MSLTQLVATLLILNDQPLTLDIISTLSSEGIMIDEFTDEVQSTPA